MAPVTRNILGYFTDMPRKINKLIKIIIEGEDFSLKAYIKIYTQLKIVKSKSRSGDYYIIL